MKTRVITSAAALALFFAVLIVPELIFGAFTGNIVFAAAISVLILIMLHECYNATQASKGIRITGFVSAGLIMLAGFPFVVGFNFHTTAEMCSLAAILIIFINMMLVIALHGRQSYRDVLTNAFLTLYVTISTAFIIITKAYFGKSCMMFIFLCAWSSDTFAYLAGKAFGKHKLIPHVSPNKTVEGAVGAVIGSAVVCVAYAYILTKFRNLSLPWLLIGIPVGAMGSVFGQIGDLVASAVKRDTGVKDFGTIFPGHGGIMDRFDSVIFIAPFVFGILAVILTLGDINYVF